MAPLSFCLEGRGSPGFRHAVKVCLVQELVQECLGDNNEQDKQHENDSCRSCEATVSVSVSFFAHAATSFSDVGLDYTI